VSGAVWIARGGALGDTFVLAPALAALRAARSDLELVGLGRLAALAPLRDAGLLDRSLDFESQDAWRAFAPAVEPPTELARELAGAELLISFGFGPLREELAALLRRDQVDRPAFPRDHSLPVWRYLHAALARELGPLGEPPPAPLASLRRGAASSRVWIHPGSGAAAKNWPLPHFLALARDLDARGIPSTFALGEAESPELEVELRRAGREVARLQLTELVPELAAARAWIGNDSGLVHLAALIGVPTLALFQASDERAWHPYGPRVRALGARGAPASIEEARRALRELLEST
jgi:heptosyltransferase-3